MVGGRGNLRGVSAIDERVNAHTKNQMFGLRIWGASVHDGGEHQNHRGLGKADSDMQPAQTSVQKYYRESRPSRLP
jgi:hypothetical protein